MMPLSSEAKSRLDGIAELSGALNGEEWNVPAKRGLVRSQALTAQIAKLIDKYFLAYAHSANKGEYLSLQKYLRYHDVAKPIEDDLNDESAKATFNNKLENYARNFAVPPLLFVQDYISEDAKEYLLDIHEYGFDLIHNFRKLNTSRFVNAIMLDYVKSSDYYLAEELERISFSQFVQDFDKMWETDYYMQHWQNVKGLDVENEMIELLTPSNRELFDSVPNDAGGVYIGLMPHIARKYVEIMPEYYARCEHLSLQKFVSDFDFREPIEIAQKAKRKGPLFKMITWFTKNKNQNNLDAATFDEWFYNNLDPELSDEVKEWNMSVEEWWAKRLNDMAPYYLDYAVHSAFERAHFPVGRSGRYKLGVQPFFVRADMCLGVEEKTRKLAKGKMGTCGDVYKGHVGLQSHRVKKGNPLPPFKEWAKGLLRPEVRADLEEVEEALFGVDRKLKKLYSVVMYDMYKEICEVHSLDDEKIMSQKEFTSRVFPEIYIPTKPRIKMPIFSDDDIVHALDSVQEYYQDFIVLKCYKGLHEDARSLSVKLTVRNFLGNACLESLADSELPHFSSKPNQGSYGPLVASLTRKNKLNALDAGVEPESFLSYISQYLIGGKESSFYKLGVLMESKDPVIQEIGLSEIYPLYLDICKQKEVPEVEVFSPKEFAKVVFKEYYRAMVDDK